MFTLFTFSISNFVYPSQPLNTASHKYRLFVAWKWHLVLLPSIFIMELIVTMYYWIMIAPNKSTPLTRGSYLDHSVPFVLLTIDFWLLSAYPMQGKHVIVILILSVSYLATNCTITLVSGEEIYGGMSWKSAVGIMLPLAVALISVCVFMCLLKLNACKLNKLNTGKTDNQI